MATNTAKYGITHPADADPADVSSVMTVAMNQIDAVMAGWNPPGLFAARPAAAAAQVGRFYYATDYGRLYMCVDAATWIDMMPPVGKLVCLPTLVPPDAFHLYCDGTPVIRGGANANLFAKYGALWGPGDGVTTFNKPDYRGRVPVGADDGAARIVTAPHAIGNVGGEEKHHLILTELPEKDLEAQPVNPGATFAVLLPSGGPAYNVTGGADVPHNNMQPFGVAAWHIRI